MSITGLPTDAETQALIPEHTYTHEIQGRVRCDSDEPPRVLQPRFRPGVLFESMLTHPLLCQKGVFFVTISVRLDYYLEWYSFESDRIESRWLLAFNARSCPAASLILRDRADRVAVCHDPADFDIILVCESLSRGPHIIRYRFTTGEEIWKVRWHSRWINCLFPPDAGYEIVSPVLESQADSRDELVMCLTAVAPHHPRPRYYLLFVDRVTGALRQCYWHSPSNLMTPDGLALVFFDIHGVWIFNQQTCHLSTLSHHIFAGLRQSGVIATDKLIVGSISGRSLPGSVGLGWREEHLVTSHVDHDSISFPTVGRIAVPCESWSDLLVVGQTVLLWSRRGDVFVAIHFDPADTKPARGMAAPV